MAIAQDATEVSSMSENKQVDPSHLSDLAQELRELLEDELLTGNRVVETYRGWPAPDSLFIMLGKPFIRKPDRLPFGVVYREINDTHYWKAEYEHQGKRHVLACGFGR